MDEAGFALSSWTRSIRAFALAHFQRSIRTRKQSGNSKGDKGKATGGVPRRFRVSETPSFADFRCRPLLLAGFPGLRSRTLLAGVETKGHTFVT